MRTSSLGCTWEGCVSVGNAKNHAYGKEQDKGMGRYNFDGRMYDERSCRWMSLDPQAAKYAGMSPYVGFNSNPIFNIDPDGNSGIAYLVKDKETGKTKIVIKSNFVFYQYKDKMNEDVTSQAAVDIMMSEMQETWNSLNASVTYEGVTYPVEFQFSGTLLIDKVGLDGPQQAVEMAKNNNDPSLNFVLFSNDISLCSGADIGTNSFCLRPEAAIDKDIPESRSPYTKSHELVGHGLGWFDYENNDEHDIKGSHKGVLYHDPSKGTVRVFGYKQYIWNKPNTMDVKNIMKPTTKGYVDFTELLSKGSTIIGKSKPDNIIYEHNGGERYNNLNQKGERGVKAGRSLKNH